MIKFVSIIIFAVSMLSLVGVHEYANPNSAHGIDIKYSETTTDKNKSDIGNLIHNHCGISCFVIPSEPLILQVKLMKKLITPKTVSLESIFSSRFKRPPRTLV